MILPRAPMSTPCVRACFVAPISLRQRTPTLQRNCCVASTSWGTDSLQNWQLRRLDDAWQIGKRKVKIKQLAGDTQLSREEVIEWFQWWGDLSEQTRDSMREARVASEEAKQARYDIIQEQNKDAALSRAADKLHYQDIQEMKRKKRRSSMTKAQQATLQMIYMKNSKYPNNKLIQEVCEMHNLSKTQVVTWFAEQRRNEGWAGQVRPHSKAADDQDDYARKPRAPQ